MTLVVLEHLLLSTGAALLAAQPLWEQGRKRAVLAFVGLCMALVSSVGFAFGPAFSSTMAAIVMAASIALCILISTSNETHGGSNTEKSGISLSLLAHEGVVVASTLIASIFVAMSMKKVHIKELHASLHDVAPIDPAPSMASPSPSSPILALPDDAPITTVTPPEPSQGEESGTGGNRVDTSGIVPTPIVDSPSAVSPTPSVGSTGGNNLDTSGIVPTPIVGSPSAVSPTPSAGITARRGVNGGIVLIAVVLPLVALFTVVAMLRNWKKHRGFVQLVP